MRKMKTAVTTTNYESVNDIILSLADVLRPPERLTVHQAAARYRYVNQPGAYVGWWDNTTAPYMVEVMNTFASREYNNMAFMGPAQCGKTDGIVINGVAYSVKVDPMDTMLFCPSNAAARDFSMRRVDRLHRHSKAIGECLIPGASSDNTFDKHYLSGMMLTLSWPSVTELAGRPVGRIIMTDFDRMPDDVEGDGNPYDLATKRTTTFGSFAMCAAESSPSRPILDPKWQAKSDHEAPPCTGIASLYNRGDRRRWQWPCPNCETWFEGQFKHLEFHREKGMSNLEVGETVRLRCPHCGHPIHYEDRHEMQQWGLWVPEGMNVDFKGRLRGKKPRTNFASFWLRGVAAAFVTWPKLIQTYLDANDEYDRTMSEEALKKFWNNDMGEPYRPKNTESIRLPEAIKSRAFEAEGKFVPEGTRFLVASVDVQKNMFRVLVMGIMPGKPFDTVAIDNFDIRKSKRQDEEGDHLWVKPATYLEDWDEIVEHVMEREYELADGSGRFMRVKQVGCDIGGKAGVTNNAYDFYRKLKEENMHGRFTLIKGEPKVSAPRTRLGFPDSQRKDNKSAARGDIPVLFLNSNLLKDNLNGRLDVEERGKGMYHVPDYMEDSFYAELCAEVKDDKGNWVNPNRVRNEVWDLSYYILGLCIAPRVIGIESIDWEAPPSWAATWDINTLVREPDKETAFAQTPNSRYDFRKLAEELG